MCLHILNNTAASDVSIINNALGATLNLINGNVAVAYWLNFPKTISGKFFYQACWRNPLNSGSEYSYAENYIFDSDTGDDVFGNITLRGQINGVDTPAFPYETQQPLDNDWHLVVVNFQAGTNANIYPMALSVDGQTLQSATGTAAMGAGVSLNRINLSGLRTAASDTVAANTHTQDTKYTFMAHRSGHFTQQECADMFGSGPAAGDGLDPYDVCGEDIINYIRFRGNLKSIVGGDWGDDGGEDYTFTSDKPLIAEHRFGSNKPFVQGSKHPRKLQRV